MKRAKKRYKVMFTNNMSNGKAGCMGTFIKREKAEHEIEINQRHDRNEVMQGYQDLQATYWIEEITIY